MTNCPSVPRSEARPGNLCKRENREGDVPKRIPELEGNGAKEAPKEGEERAFCKGNISKKQVKEPDAERERTGFKVFSTSRLL